MGTFQDAGPLENNPIISALAECKVAFPTVKKPNFVVSLGTGSAHTSELYPTIVARLKFWRNRTLVRLYRLFMEKTRDRLIASAFRSDTGVHRLDISFDAEEPRLDDASSITMLKSRVLQDDSLSPAINAVARKLTASLFYFELNALPEHSNGRYWISGSILCSLSYPDPAYKSLLEQLTRDSAELYLDDIPVCSDFEDDLRLYARTRFCKPVTSYVAEDFAICLRTSTTGLHHISGSPWSVNLLSSSQGFYHYFGRSDHKKRILNSEDSPRKKRCM